MTTEPRFIHVTTIVLHRDGRLRFTSDKITLADAERWAHEGFHVFRVAADGPTHWVMNHVESGCVITEADAARGLDRIHPNPTPLASLEPPKES